MAARRLPHSNAPSFFAFSQLDFCPSFEWSEKHERERINSAEEECATPNPEYEKERKGMPFLALLLAFFTHLNGHTRSRLQDERGGEGQKPPTCEDKASDSCATRGRRRELILELRLEVKERGRAGIQLV